MNRVLNSQFQRANWLDSAFSRSSTSRKPANQEDITPQKIDAAAEPEPSVKALNREKAVCMQRVAFLLRLKPGTGSDYDKAHSAVWPELLALLKRAGISEYSIFRRDEILFLYMRTGDDFDTVWDRIEVDPVNARWQQAMSAYFLPAQDTRPGERFPFMQEVFYLP